jgi:hypothetical protein
MIDGKVVRGVPGSPFLLGIGRTLTDCAEVRLDGFIMPQPIEPAIVQGRETMRKYLSILPTVRRIGEWARHIPLVAMPALCAFGLLVGAAAAQQPTQAQRDAVKSACRSDYMAQCSSVTPGGREALQCLQQHNASLSASCQKAVAAISGGGTTTPAATSPAKPAASARAPTAAQRNAIKSASMLRCPRLARRRSVLLGAGLRRRPPAPLRRQR